MKGIILAGGSGTRLYPLTLGLSKQLCPVYDKPMVYYPLSTLMLAGLRDVLVITTPEDQAGFVRLLGDGSQFGIRISYAAQPKPEGLAQAFLIGQDVRRQDGVALALGDNLFYGHGLPEMLQRAAGRAAGRDGLRLPRPRPAALRRRRVRRAGAAPSASRRSRRSRARTTPSRASTSTTTASLDIAATLEALAARRARDHGRQPRLPRDRRPPRRDPRARDGVARHGHARGAPQASNFIQAIEARQGLKVACPEEIAWNDGWISSEDVTRLASRMNKNEYGAYLLRMLEEGRL